MATSVFGATRLNLCCLNLIMKNGLTMVQNVYLLRVLPSVCFCLKELVVVIVILLSDKTKGNYFKALLAFSVPEHYTVCFTILYPPVKSYVVKWP